MTQEWQTSSTRPYLIRALHEWCGDNGLTPYVTVLVDSTVQVPREYVKNGEIVLNIGFEATTGLMIGNEYLEFKARFSGMVRDIMVPINRVAAIFAKENGQGMAFPCVDFSEEKADDLPEDGAAIPAVPRLSPVQRGVESEQAKATSSESSVLPKSGARPSLTRIK